jgi:hypothetical protein
MYPSLEQRGFLWLPKEQEKDIPKEMEPEEEVLWTQKVWKIKQLCYDGMMIHSTELTNNHWVVLLCVFYRKFCA